jgi:hypothetical protein
MIGKIELLLACFLIFTLTAVSIILLPGIKTANLTTLNPAKMFAPYGVILFACLGYSIIPEVEIALGREKKKMLRAIVIAMAVCLAIYGFFTFAMVGTYGTSVSEMAMKTLNGKLFILGNIVAVASMTGAFLSVGTVTKHIYHFDFKIDDRIAWAMACFVPLLLMLVFTPSFGTAVELTGTYAGGLTGILCCIMVKRARKKGNVKPAYVVPGGNVLIWMTAIVFALGMVYQTLQIFGFI